jgi:hypothetical protein
MSPTSGRPLHANPADSWSVGAASLGFWEVFVGALSKKAQELDFEDHPILALEFTPLRPDQRWTTLRPGLTASRGFLRFEASLEVPSASILFSFHAVGLERHLGSDDHRLRFGWIRWQETQSGLVIESTHAVPDCVTDGSAIAYADFTKRAEVFSDWVFAEIVTRSVELLTGLQ